LCIKARIEVALPDIGESSLLKNMGKGHVIIGVFVFGKLSKVKVDVIQRRVTAIWM